VIDVTPNWNLDMTLFKTMYLLWRKMNVDVDVDVDPFLNFPLPRCACLIPYQHSFWNCVKSGSDTLTKLLGLMDEKLGIRTPGTCATARMLQGFVISSH
jgi:hypothetical protein